MTSPGLRRSGRLIFRSASFKKLAGGDGSIFRSIAFPDLKRKASNSWSAVQDTFYSTKEVFESHKVVFTVGTSIASVLTAWAGYSLRQLHQSKLDKRLKSIEESIHNKYNVEHEEIKKIVSSGSVSTTACVATASTTLIFGYALGWRGGAWFANRRFLREQLKLVGHIKPRGWHTLRGSLGRFRSRSVQKASELPVDATKKLQEQGVQKA